MRTALSQVECDVNESNDDTKDCVQVCSILQVAHVYVRRVIHVIVHYGLNDVECVLVVLHTFTKPFVRELLYQEVFSLHTLSVTVDCCQLFPI